MFTKKKMISQEKVHEIADLLRDELNAEIEKTIKERSETHDRDHQKIDNLYAYQHALEHSRMNITTLVHRIDVAINYK